MAVVESAAAAASPEDDINEFVEPLADGLRGGCNVDDRRDGSARLQLFGTLTAHRL